MLCWDDIIRPRLGESGDEALTDVNQLNCQLANTTGANFTLGMNNLTLQSVGRSQNGDNITCVMNDVIIGPAALLTVQCE